MNGKLEIIIGNMFSGKTSELLRRINREKSIHKKILIINYISDNRYSEDSIVSHDHIGMKCLKIEKLSELVIDDYDSIFIDEAQFFDDLYTQVVKLVDIYKKHVVICGLDGDFNRMPFGDIIKLIPISDSVLKLRAYCNKCNDGTYGPFTKKINDSKNVIEIGGSDMYIPVCRTHYLN